MKYCIHYHYYSKFRYFDDIDEIEIYYRREDTTLPAFIEKYSTKTIVVTIQDVHSFVDNKDIERMIALQEKYQNLKLKFPYLSGELLSIVKDSKIPFFFSDYIDNWDMLNGLITEGPTDIYIVNDMGFSIKKVAAIAHASGVRVRCFPNVAQSQWKKMDPIKKFFIRPDDVAEYEPYVDLFEFFGDEHRFSTLYEIYRDNQNWFGKLNEIIDNFDSDIDNRGIVSVFPSARISCGKRCAKGSSCNICSCIESLSDSLLSNHLMVKKVPIETEE